MEAMKGIAFVNDFRKLLAWLMAAGLVVGLCLATTCVFCPVCKAENVPLHASAERSGELPAGDARTFSLVADMGSVHILAQPACPPPTLRHTVHLETHPHPPLPQTLF